MAKRRRRVRKGKKVSSAAIKTLKKKLMRICRIAKG